MRTILKIILIGSIFFLTEVSSFPQEEVSFKKMIGKVVNIGENYLDIDDGNLYTSGLPKRIYLDEDTQIKKKEETLTFKDISLNDKVEIKYRIKFLGKFRKRIAKEILIKE